MPPLVRDDHEVPVARRVVDDREREAADHVGDDGIAEIVSAHRTDVGDAAAEVSSAEQMSGGPWDRAHVDRPVVRELAELAGRVKGGRGSAVFQMRRYESRRPMPTSRV
jgi:hypothetical protein